MENFILYDLPGRFSSTDKPKTFFNLKLEISRCLSSSVGSELKAGAVEVQKLKNKSTTKI